MSHTRRRVTGVLLAVMLISGGAAACADNSETHGHGAKTAQPSAQVNPATAVRQAAEKSAKVTSMKYKMTGSAAGQKIDATATIGLKPVAMAFAMKNPDSEGPDTIDMRLVDGSMYIDGGAENATEDSRHWIKFDVKELAESTGSENPLEELGGQANQDPSANVSLLTESGDLKEVGKETIDGVQTTHYTGTATVADLLAGSGSKFIDKERQKAAIDQLKAAGIDRLTMDIWIGPDNRTVQFRERATTSQGQMDLTIKFLALNIPVTVKAPPADETYDLSDLMGDKATSA